MSIILGIDPGSRITGYGVIRFVGGKPYYVASGCIRTNTQSDLGDRLFEIFEGLREIIQTHQPMEAAIEQIFMHENPGSALKLGQARGVAIVAAAQYAIPVSEYSARQIKQAVVGYGNAEKKQVQMMVKELLGLSSCPQADAADGLAVAVCHAYFKKGIAALSGATKQRRGRLR
jgi:crossover junction endodeoxyribonuclease RuvC